MTEGVYLIHTRELHTQNLYIYKFGRSHNLDNRIKQYPKGSKSLFLMFCDNSIFCEKELLKIFKEKFIQKLEYGSEYFEGDKKLMIREIFNFIDKQVVIKTEIKTKIIKKKVKKEIKKVIKKEIKKKENDDKSDRICKKCNTCFSYPSLLKRHFKLSSRCSISDEEIEEFFNPKLKTISCSKCNKLFSRKCSLVRHENTVKCDNK